VSKAIKQQEKESKLKLGIPIMHVLTTIIRDCINLQDKLSKVDPSFVETQIVRDLIQAEVKKDLFQISESSRSTLTSASKLRKINSLSKSIYSKCPKNFQLLMKFLNVFQTSVYEANCVGHSKNQCRLSILLSSFLVYSLYGIWAEKADILEQIHKKTITELQNLLIINRLKFCSHEYRIKVN